MRKETAGLRSSVRALLGEWAGDQPGPPPPLPEGLPESVIPVVAQAVDTLIVYQGLGYARLYLQRLKRFVGRRDVDDALFSAIAKLMADRMAYEDAIRIAQLTLRDAGGGDRICKFRMEEPVCALPDLIADPVLWLLERAGWLHVTVTRSFTKQTAWGVRRLRVEAGLRSWRRLSVRYARERVWVERWLHMVDRALAKQPEAAGVIAQTATMIQGYGDAYRQGLADWNLIIDQLAKPVFDGDFRLPDLAAAVVTARAAALPDPRQTNLRRVIAAIRSEAGAPARV